MKKTIFVFLSLAIIMFVNIGASRHPITLSIIKSSTSWRSMFYVLDEFAVANNTTTAKYKVYVSTNSNFFKLAMPFYVGGTTQTYRAYIDTAGYIYSLSSGKIAGSMTANSFIGNGASLTGVLCSSVAVNAVTTNTILNDAVNPVTKIGAGLMASDVIVSSVAKGAITDNVLPDKFTATSTTITAISCTNIWGDGSHLTGIAAGGGSGSEQHEFVISGTQGVGDEQGWFVSTTTGVVNGIVAWVKTAPTTSVTRYDIERSSDNGTSWHTIFTSKYQVEVDTNEYTSITAAKNYVIDTDYDDIDWGYLLRINVDVGGGAINGNVTFRIKQD